MYGPALNDPFPPYPEPLPAPEPEKSENEKPSTPVAVIVFSHSGEHLFTHSVINPRKNVDMTTYGGRVYITHITDKDGHEYVYFGEIVVRYEVL